VEDIKKPVPTLSIPKYAAYSGMSVPTVRALCEKGELPIIKIGKGQIRIKMIDDYVPREIYEELKKENTFLREKLRSAKAALKDV